MESATALAKTVGVAPACAALGLPRASFYRFHRPLLGPAPARPRPTRGLAQSERDAVLHQLHSPRFQNDSAIEVCATLLDEGQYYCSSRTMYRLLAAAGESHERRNQLVQPSYQKPALLASWPNPLWSWDITKLLGPAKWTYYYQYLILDVFSRHVVGWIVAHRESAALAKHRIGETCAKQGIARDSLTMHADRGSSMTSKPVAFLLSHLEFSPSICCTCNGLMAPERYASVSTASKTARETPPAWAARMFPMSSGISMAICITGSPQLG